jgi:uncharacterized protein (TIGR02646 family)
MIKVNKSADVPIVLARQGATERARLCSEFERHAADFLSGARDFAEFKSSVYGHKSVKEQLIAEQHGKCFLCESSFRHVAHGDVEHFRPKGGFQQADGDALGKPGYFWLAYDWHNLFLSCQICNQTFKRNLFPLYNPQARARSHAADTNAERPLIVNPAIDDPQKYISFRAEMPYAVRNSRRGKATIEAAGINRGALVGRRRDYYQLIKLAYRTVHLPPTADLMVEENRAFARTILDQSVLATAEYASMIRAAVKARFRIV